MKGSIVHRTLILASKSPRRAEILGDAGIEVKIISADIDEESFFSAQESSSKRQSISDAVQRLALEKARSVAAFNPDDFVLGADTVVALDGRVFGKPGSPDDAADMLRQLSGRSHDVITGVAVVGPDGEFKTNFVSTSVLFRSLGDDEIADYVASGQPFDKAGGYGIQDSFFAPVSSYDDCYLNVVGLPMCATSELLENTGLIPGEIACLGHARHDNSVAKVTR